jgi:hypothetical protein
MTQEVHTSTCLLDHNAQAKVSELGQLLIFAATCRDFFRTEGLVTPVRPTYPSEPFPLFDKPGKL